MTPTRRSRFAPPAPARAKRTRTVEVRPIGGVHKGLPPQDLQPGMSPDARNFTPDPDGFIRPRSGLSSNDTHAFGGAVLGAAEVYDIEGRSCGFAPSSRSFSFLHPETAGWSELSYVPGALSWMSGPPSGLSSDYYNTVSIYDPSSDDFIAITSNATDSFKFFTVASDASTFSDFTFADSIDSTSGAKDVESVNDRLFLFNTRSSTGTKYPTRTMWSARGNPKSFLINDGAGSEDLMDMKGEGQAAVRFRDFLILFTEREIWRATPTLDDFAFRFDRVVDNIGCRFPNTISVTPNGVLFLGRDREVYATDGSGVVPMGSVGGEGPSRIQRILVDEAFGLGRAWSVYNQTDNRYELYYATVDSTNGYPDRAIHLSLEDRTWWPQRFNHNLASGVDLVDPTEKITWDELEDSWDDQNATWDSFDVIQGNRRINVFTSGGSLLRFSSDQTTDDGTSIDARWRSGGLRAKDFRNMHLTEVWMDYEADASSNVSVFAGNARDTTDLDGGTEVSLSSPGGVSFVPVWKTERAPAFEIRLDDGGRPRIASFSATLKDASRF